MRSAKLLCAFLFLWVLSAGCGAAYSGHMRGTLKRLGNRDYEGALARLEDRDNQTDKLLYRLEKGLILHYNGQYEESNRLFEKAERLIDKRYARSVSREIAALLTNDAVRAYSGEEFERVIIHYYRAMNYQYLGLPQEALVECRKANLMLEDYAAAAEYELSYKNDAFLQYMSGLFFEAEGEWNDAYISYKDAEKGYLAYEEALGLETPAMLGKDLARMAHRLDYAEDVAAYMERYALHPEDLHQPVGGEVIVFIESGFIARKHQREISLPILEEDDRTEVWALSDELVYRYHNPYRRYEVDYYLKVALPEYRANSTRIRGARLRGGDQSADAEVAQDLDAIAFKSIDEKMDTVLLRTAARALAKYLATELVEEKSEFWGTLVNLFGVATEAADTRGWVSLPARIDIARFSLPPGTVDLVVEFLNDSGVVVETHPFPAVEVESGKPVILSCRSYR